MNYLNLPLAIFHAPEVVGCDPTQRATWLWLYVFCAEQENGGVIQGCKSWKDRRWQQTCQVTLSEVLIISPLWTWTNADLCIWGYLLDAEKRARLMREGAVIGNLNRWANRLGVVLPNRPPNPQVLQVLQVLQVPLRGGGESPPFF